MKKWNGKHPAAITAAVLAVSLLFLTTPRAGADDPPPPPTNLLPNPNFELDADRNGIPDGWHHSNPQYWTGPAPNSERWNELHDRWVETGAVPDPIPFRDPGTREGGRYGWEATGIDGGRCISIDQTEDRMWGEWNAVVRGIKPNTDYVILGRRRQMMPDPTQGNASMWLKVAVFGRMIPIRGTIHEDRWIPFAVTVNSGDFQGTNRIGFIVNRAPTKVWIDRVAMFEGTLEDIPRFYAGNRGAKVEYPYNEPAYASPDVQSPLFFDILWSFPGGDPELRIEIDLPEGLRLASAAGSGLELALPTEDGEPVTQPKAIRLAGRNYERWTFRLPGADEQTAMWSGGERPVRFWLRANPDLPDGTFRAYYRATWRGGMQAIQPLDIEILRIPETGRPRALDVYLGGLSSGMLENQAETLAVPLAKRGIRGLIADKPVAAETAVAMQGAGVAPAAWYELRGSDAPEACRARNVDGDVVPGVVCPSCRPENAVETIFAGPVALVEQGVTTLFVDLRNGMADLCYCERCVAEFKRFVERRQPDLDFVSPQTLAAEPDEHAEVRELWGRFRTEQFADLHWTLRRQLDRHRREAEPALPNASTPLKLYAVVPGLGRGSEAARRDAMVDYARLASVFDAELVEPRMYLSDDARTPRMVGRKVERLANVLPAGGKAGVVIMAGSVDDPAAVTPVLDRRDIRDQVLESVLSGAQVVVMPSFQHVDALALKQFTEAIRLVAPFDDLLSDGGPVGVVSVGRGRGQVRAWGKPDRMLLLVTDYITRPVAQVELSLRFPEPEEEGNPPAEMVLVDLAAGEVVGDAITAETESVTAPLGGSRARLFYLGPRANLPEPVEGR